MNINIISVKGAPKKYELWSLKSVLTFLGIILLLIGFILIIFNITSDKLNVNIPIISSILTLIGSFLIYILSIAQIDPLDVAQINNNILLTMIFATSAQMIYIMRSNPTAFNNNLWFDFAYWTRIITTGFGILTTSIIIYYI